MGEGHVKWRIPVSFFDVIFYHHDWIPNMIWYKSNICVCQMSESFYHLLCRLANFFMQLKVMLLPNREKLKLAKYGMVLRVLCYWNRYALFSFIFIGS